MVLTWIYVCDKTRLNKIRNNNIRENVGITHVVKNGENRLKWFSYVEKIFLNSILVDRMEKNQTTRGR